MCRLRLLSGDWMRLQFSLRLQKWFILIRPLDALVLFSIVLQTYRSTRELSLGLLVIWLAWRLLVAFKEGASDGISNGFRFNLALFLGLLLVNTRLIVLRDDVRGPTQFLLIALGFVVGASLNQQSWRRLMFWLGVSAIPLGFLFLNEAITFNFALTFGSIEQIYNTTMRGHGGINRFATLSLILTVSAWYSFFFSRGNIARGLASLGVITGYILCIGSGSRLSVAAAPLSIFIAWSVLRIKARSKKLQSIVIGLYAILFSGLGLWWFLLSPSSAINRAADYYRLEAARCWLSILFSGTNRFIYGVGYGADKANEICHHIPDFRGELGTIGHAHNTFAQMAGQHGILGIIALVIFVSLVFVGLRNQLSKVQEVLPLGPEGMTWAEAALGINLALAFTSFTTTIFIYSQLNQVLIGLLAATSLASPPSTIEKHRDAKPIDMV